MRVEPVSTDRSVAAPPAGSPTVGATVGGKRTANPLTTMLDEVNWLQADADRKVEHLAVGRADNIHDAIIALEKANLALQFTIQVTKKAVEAYQEIMRMPL